MRPGLLRTAAAAAGLALLAPRLPAAQSSAARPGAADRSADVRTISAGFSLTEPLPSQQHRRFAIDLAVNEFLFVTVDQRDIDVAVRLSAPDGTELVTSDSPNSTRGPERVAWVAAAGGRYEIDVANTAPAAVGSAGSYEIRVRDLRRATSDDQAHAQAEKDFSEGERLVAGGANTPAVRADAERRLRAAHDVFAAQQRRYEQGLCLFRLGFLQLRAGNPRAAIPDLERARGLFEPMDPMRASVLNALGGALDLTGDPTTAMAYYREALSIFAAVGDPARQAVANNNIGALYADQGEWSKAIDQYRQALPVFQQIGDRRRQALALYNIGVSYTSLGELTRSVSYLEESLSIRQAINDRAGQADTFTQLGLAATLSGDPPRALAYFDTAIQLRRAVGDRRTEGVTLTYQGRAYLAARDVPKALDVLEQAVRLRRDSGDTRGHAAGLLSLADALAAARRPDESLARAREAETILRGIGDGHNLAESLLAQARAHRDAGRLEDARRLVFDAMSAFESVRGAVANPETRAAYLGRHQVVYDLALEILMAFHAQQPQSRHDALALQVSERAKARSLLDLLNESGAELRQGAEAALLERERDLTRRLDAKASRLVTVRAGASSSDGEVLARELQALEAEYDEVRARIRATSPEYSALTQPQPLDADAIRRDVLDADTTLIEYALGSDASYVWIVDRAGLRSTRLPPRTEIEDASRAAYQLVTSRATVVPRESAAEHTKRIAASDAALPAALRRVSDLVLAPIGAMPTTSRLLVVADGALQYLPFEMLPRPQGRAGAERPLVADYEITALPSASTLAVHRAQIARRPAPSRGLAVFADPVFDLSDARVRQTTIASARPVPDADGARLLTQTDDAVSTLAPARIPRLPFTGDEARAILATARGRQNLSAIGFEATKAAANGDALARYRYVHFATHGFLDAERPSLSAIALSLVGPDGAAREGFLRAHEIYNLNLSADLVVLSACQTGLGKEIRGEGLVGLTRAFMYAGAARVIVSLWSVSDRATASLMGLLYREMLRNGRTPSASLRAAQLALRSDARWQHPYYWAAFTIQGDWK